MVNCGNQLAALRRGFKKLYGSDTFYCSTYCQEGANVFRNASTMPADDK